jgi:pimeloyl-ACP methyl ester carboxylesterase
MNAAPFHFLFLTLCAYQSYGQVTDTFSILNHSKIYYHKVGSGNPAVVFVSGLGEDHKTWQLVQDSISNSTITISYDRAGLGASEYHGEKKDLHSLATELEQLLKAASISKPVVLVGHSLGCQIIKEYASRYPKDVAGLVFVDPGYNEQKLRAAVPDSVWQKREAALKKYIPKLNTAQQAEMDNLNRNCELADHITALRKVPIVLLTATHINPNFPGSAIELQVKRKTHRHWLHSLPWAGQAEVAGSRHYIQNDAPATVIQVIRRMLAKHLR